MIDNRYSLGRSLRDTIIAGIDEKTELRNIFEKKLSQVAGITVCHSYFNQDTTHPYIAIAADMGKNPQFFCASDWERHQDIFYPKLNMRKTIVDCFNASVVEQGLSALTFPNDESIDIISAIDYKGISANIYFNLNIADIDRAAQQAFPNTEFDIRFRMSYETEHYYLIYNDLKSKENADEDGTTSNITNFILNFCQRHDPLHIFDDNEVNPIVTTKDEIIGSGMAMGIFRDNAFFTSR